MTFHVNYLAVLVAAVAAFALGALWYSPLLFAKRWVAAHGYSPEKVAEMQKDAPRAYGVSFVCFLVLSFCLAILVGRIGVQTALGGVKLGGLCWLGFAATLGLTANVYSDKKIETFVIDAGYQLVYLLLMGVILSVWR